MHFPEIQTEANTVVVWLCGDIVTGYGTRYVPMLHVRWRKSNVSSLKWPSWTVSDTRVD